MSTGDPPRAAATQPPMREQDVQLCRAEPVRLVAPASSCSLSKREEPTAPEPENVLPVCPPIDWSDQAECEGLLQDAINIMLCTDQPAHLRAELEELQRTGVYPILFGEANARNDDVQEVEKGVRGRVQDNESINESNEVANLPEGMRNHHRHSFDGERVGEEAGNVTETRQPDPIGLDHDRQTAPLDSAGHAISFLASSNGGIGTNSPHSPPEIDPRRDQSYAPSSPLSVASTSPSSPLLVALTSSAPPLPVASTSSAPPLPVASTSKAAFDAPTGDKVPALIFSFPKGVPELPEEFPVGFQFPVEDVVTYDILPETDFDRLLFDLPSATSQRLKRLVSTAELEGRRLLVVLLWWDSKTKSWRRVLITLPYLVRWANRLLRRDLGLLPGEYALEATVVVGSANTPHQNLPRHSLIPYAHSFKRASTELLMKADVILCIGIRGLGYNLASHHEFLLPMIKNDAIIVTTRAGGHQPSLYLEPAQLKSAVLRELTELGVVANSRGHVRTPRDVFNQARVYNSHPFDNSRIEQDPEGFVVYTMATGYLSRALIAWASEFANVTGNRWRLPQLLKFVDPEDKKPDDKAQRPKKRLRKTEASGKSQSARVPNQMAAAFALPNISGSEGCTTPGCQNPWSVKKWRICDACYQHHRQSKGGAPIAPDRVEPPRDSTSRPSGPTGKRPFKCRECGNTFSIENNYNAHLVQAGGCRPFHCDVPGCAFETARAHTLQRHVRENHPDQRAHPCTRTGCDRAFRRPVELESHYDWHDNVNAAADHVCQTCQKHFVQSSARHRHVNENRCYSITAQRPEVDASESDNDDA